MNSTLTLTRLYARCARRHQVATIGGGCALLLLVTASALQGVVVGEPARALADVGLFVLWLLNLVVAAGLALSFVTRERGLLEVQPVGHGSRVRGQFLGLTVVLMGWTLALAGLLAILHSMSGGHHSLRLLVAAAFQSGEALLLAGTLMGLARLCAPLPALCGGLLVFAIGHTTTDARPMLGEDAPALWRGVVDAAYYALPNFDHLAVQEAALRTGFGDAALGWRAAYFVFYSAVLLTLASYAARRGS